MKRVPYWQRYAARVARKRLIAALKSVEKAPATETTYLNVLNSGLIVRLDLLKRAAAKALRQHLEQ